MDIDTGTTASPAPGGKPRRPWIAALLTIFTPGLGHLYTGEPARGALALMALWGAIAGWALFSMHVPVPTLRIGLFLLVLALYVWIVFDAVRLARAAPANYWPRQYHRVLIYVALVAFLGFILQPAFTATIQATTAHAYRFPSGAMSPTILAGDYFYVSPHVPDQIQRGHLIALARRSGG